MTKVKRARIESQSLASRLTGLSLFSFGASWKAPEPERDVVRSVVHTLEDKRALYVDHIFEVQVEVIQSLVDIRRALTDGITRVSDSSPAAKAFRAPRTMPVRRVMATKAGVGSL